MSSTVPRLRGRPRDGWINDPVGCWYIDGLGGAPLESAFWLVRSDAPVRAWRLETELGTA
jgi:hypothetical protein